MVVPAIGRGHRRGVGGLLMATAASVIGTLIVPGGKQLAGPAGWTSWPPGWSAFTSAPRSPACSPAGWSSARIAGAPFRVAARAAAHEYHQCRRRVVRVATSTGSGIGGTYRAARYRVTAETAKRPPVTAATPRFGLEIRRLCASAQAVTDTWTGSRRSGQARPAGCCCLRHRLERAGHPACVAWARIAVDQVLPYSCDLGGSCR
jgi:hypothetical protein